VSLTEDGKRVLLADAMLVMVAFIWGAGISISADLVRTLSPLWSCALRFSVSGVAVSLLCASKIRRATMYEWRCGMALAFFIVSQFSCMSFALFYSTASKQAFFIGSSVLMVPFLAWAVNRTRPHPAVFAGAALGTAGLMTMGFTPGMRFNLGDLLNFAMCLIWAAQVIAVERIVKKMDPTSLVALQLPLAGAVLLAFAFMFEGPMDILSIQGATWGEIFFMGLVSTILCFILQTKAQKNTTASHVAIILALESVFGYIISVLSGQDPFIAQGAIGGVMITLGVVVSETETIKNR
jgi:drug/metabolite transporter (DMT)-like permease